MFGKKRHNGDQESISSMDSSSSPTLSQGRERQSFPLKRTPSFSSSAAATHHNMLTSEVPSRPYLTRVPSVQTRYMEMLLHLDQIPRVHNILASLFTWILLAGFLVIPGTFTSVQNSAAFKDAAENERDKVAHAILDGIKNIGLVWVSGAFCLIGALGCLWLWVAWRKNYVWLLNRIFLYV